MKASVVLIVAAGLFASTQSLARRGGESDDRPGRPARGTAAWFVQEAGETAVRTKIAAGQLAESAPTGLFVTLTSADTADVIIATGAGQVTDACFMRDESSRGGTVIKKETYCALGETDFDETRGSNAWAMIEGIQHALRAELLVNAGIASQVVSASSQRIGDNVAVAIGLADGSMLEYNCTQVSSASRGGTVRRADLNCIKN